jgi:hypothetical protein
MDLRIPTPLLLQDLDRDTLEVLASKSEVGLLEAHLGGPAQGRVDLTERVLVPGELIGQILDEYLENLKLLLLLLDPPDEPLSLGQQGDGRRLTGHAANVWIRPDVGREMFARKFRPTTGA